MKSKIRVEFDFDAKEPFIQLYLDDTNDPGTQSDMRDQMLKNFIEKTTHTGLVVYYPEDNHDNKSPELRPMREGEAMSFVSEILHGRLKDSMIKAHWEPLQSAWWSSDGSQREASNIESEEAGIQKIDNFKAWAVQFFQETEMHLVESFFNALTTKASLRLLNPKK